MSTARSLETLDTVLTKYRCHPMFSYREDISVSSRGMDGDSILHKAVVSHDIESVRILLEGNADPNFAGEMGCTPLHEAVERGDFLIIEALLMAGASPIVRSEFGQSPLDVAASHGKGSIVTLLKRYAK